MGLPSFQELMLPALQMLGQRYDEISIAGLEDEVVRALDIPSDEREQMLLSQPDNFRQSAQLGALLSLEGGPDRAAATRLLSRHGARAQAAGRRRKRNRHWGA